MFSPARSARTAAIINATTRGGMVSIRMRARKNYVQSSSHVKLPFHKSDVVVKPV